MAHQDELAHLTGARALAALWVISAHYLPRSPAEWPPFANSALLRDNVAVDFFVVLSGFMTQWAYGSLDFSSSQGLLQYYARRLGRIVLTTWISMARGHAVCHIARLVLGSCIAFAAGQRLDLWHAARCIFFVEQWRPLPHNWCPSRPTWFVFALLPAWLGYPVIRIIAAALVRYGGATALAGASVLLYGVSFGPLLGRYLAQGGNLTWGQGAYTLYYPHVLLPDFVIGVLAAVLARHVMQRRSEQRTREEDEEEEEVAASSDSTDTEASADKGDEPSEGAAASALEEGPHPELSGASRQDPQGDQDPAASCPAPDGSSRQEPRAHRAWALLVDVSFFFVVACVCLLPTPCLPNCDLRTYGWEPLLDHGLAPALAAFLAGSALAEAGQGGGGGGGGGRGCAPRLLRQGYLVELGRLSFEVYIFQEPIYNAFSLFADMSGMDSFLAYLVSLFLFAGVYGEVVGRRLSSWLQRVISQSGFRSTVLMAAHGEQFQGVST